MTEANQDLEMMITPLNWPRWPWLPVKRKIEERTTFELGVLYANDEPKVWLMGLFDHKTSEELQSVPTRIYNSFEELVADGWLVD